MNTNTRLTIPMDKDLRNSLQSRAKNLGFDSSQALLRYVAKAIIDGRTVTFGQEDSWGEPPESALKRWQQEADELQKQRTAGKVKSYTDVDDLMKDLLADEAGWI